MDVHGVDGGVVTAEGFPQVRRFPALREADVEHELLGVFGAAAQVGHHELFEDGIERLGSEAPEPSRFEEPQQFAKLVHWSSVGRGMISATP